MNKIKYVGGTVKKKRKMTLSRYNEAQKDPLMQLRASCPVKKEITKGYIRGNST